MTVIVDDAFTTGSDIAITSHTPTTAGTGYTEQVNSTGKTVTVYAASNDTKPDGNQNGSGVVITADNAPGVADYDVELTFTGVHTGSGTRPFHILARWVDSSNFYDLQFLRSNYGDPIRIYKTVGGSTTELVKGGGTGLAANDRWKFEMRGTTLKAYRDSGSGYSEVLSVTDSAISSAGKAGFAWGNSGGGVGGHMNNAWVIDDFLVTDTAAGPSISIPVLVHNYRRRRV